MNVLNISKIGAALLFALASMTAGAGTLLLNNLGNATSSVDETRSPAFGILARIEVGAANVAIGKFGVYGHQITSGNVRYDIFNSSMQRIYDSGVIAASGAASNQWYDSPEFNLVLSANSAYYFGLLSDKQFSYHWEGNSTAEVGLGLTSPQSGIGGSNGNFNNFASPTATDYCCGVQQSTRIFATNVPEPASLGLLGIGMLGLGLSRRRFSRK